MSLRRRGPQHRLDRGPGRGLAVANRPAQHANEPPTASDEGPDDPSGVRAAGFQAYSASGDRAINSISRGALNNALLSAAADAPGVTVEFEQRLVELDSQAGRMVFATPAGKVSASADVVLGADGAGFAVREQLLAEGIVAEDVDFLDYGYKELSIPVVSGDFALDARALHIWPRGTSMMIALPNPDGPSPAHSSGRPDPSTR